MVTCVGELIPEALGERLGYAWPEHMHVRNAERWCRGGWNGRPLGECCSHSQKKGMPSPPTTSMVYWMAPTRRHKSSKPDAEGWGYPAFPWAQRKHRAQGQHTREGGTRRFDPHTIGARNVLWAQKVRLPES